MMVFFLGGSENSIYGALNGMTPAFTIGGCWEAYIAFGIFIGVIIGSLDYYGIKT